jgi:branched-subunit amino acid aminotransferase/4-amino-4-deoxychorismate lyase
MLEQALRETIRIHDGRVPLLGRHLYRLESGGCGHDTLERAKAEALEAAKEWEPQYGRMTLEVSVDDEISIDITEQPSSITVEGGPRIVLVDSETPPLPPGAAKPADRSFWDRALAEANAQGGDVALLVDDRGRIMDGSQATVWFVFGAVLVTPPSPPALAGVSRFLVMDSAPMWGYAVEERPVTQEDLLACDEIFLTTAVGGAVDVRGHAGFAAPRINAHIERIFKAGHEEDD